MGNPRVTGTLRPADWHVKRNHPGPEGGECQAGRTNPQPRLSEHLPAGRQAGAGMGRSSKRGFGASSAERFVGPFARLVGRGGIGRVMHQLERGLTGRWLSRTPSRGAVRSPGAQRRGAGSRRGMGRASGPSTRRPGHLYPSERPEEIRHHHRIGCHRTRRPPAKNWNRLARKSTS